jgi:hypothetical protein
MGYHIQPLPVFTRQLQFPAVPFPILQGFFHNTVNTLGFTEFVDSCAGSFFRFPEITPMDAVTPDNPQFRILKSHVTREGVQETPPIKIGHIQHLVRRS